ncbi:MAG: formate dehydrogenase accessory sulfurtransferase FdhD, partial [Planctomycetota bacterium]|nr:formate dehydrogenase accessory sulfurtransferase FdhD [Planctomycetota bacterium]
MGQSRKIQKTVYVADGEHKQYSDFVAIEDPMAIKVNGHYFATVMRTPGRDLDLSVGLLAAEGIVDGPEDISALKECDEDNTVNIALADGCSFDISKARTISVSTACGICGTRSIAALQQELMSAQVMQFDDLSASTLFE